MKRTLYFIVILFSCLACQNQDFDFPDFDYNAVYFPVQYPVRSLVLGKDRIDNSMDKELKFLIGVAIGGMYENKKSWTVDYVVDETLINNLINADGDTLKALPAEYYTLSPGNQVTIPAGKFSGFIEVQLDERFLDDPRSSTSSYVIPLRITNSDADSVLFGKPLTNSPNRHIAADWDPNAGPKDYVLYGINYINPYHGFYLHRGVDKKYEPADNLISEVVYHEKYVEKDQVVNLLTLNVQSSLALFVGNITSGKNGKSGMELVFNEDGDIVVKKYPNSTYTVSGSGSFIIDGGAWGGAKHNAIYLNYHYLDPDGINRHEVFDTLVFRNNGISFKENSIRVY
jgi:hypothetical protein